MAKIVQTWRAQKAVEALDLNFEGLKEATIRKRLLAFFVHKFFSRNSYTNWKSLKKFKW